MKINVGVFMGGSSVEHEISIISAVQAMKSLDTWKYCIVPVYISKDGKMYSGEALTDLETFRKKGTVENICRRVVIRRDGDGVFMYHADGGFGKRKPICRIDVALPVVHGTNCEDGTLQGFFELLALPYCGCDVLSSSVGMDKELFKYVVAAKGVPVLPCVCFRAREWVSEREELTAKIRESFGFPVIVKPANLGSSVGIKKVTREEELPEAVDYACSFADKILVEKAVTALREINCSVLGDCDEAKASVCEEPVMCDEILSYADKYMSSGSSKGMSSLKRKLPADISAEKSAEIADLSVKTFKALGCCGVVRIDYLMDTADNDKVYVNEINTIPGSLAFYLWEVSGMKYSALLDKLIELAFRRNRERERLSFSYDTDILQSASFGTKGSKGKA